MLTYTVTVNKVAQRRMNEGVLKDHLTFIRDSALRNRSVKWDLSIPKKLICEVENGNGIHYSAVIKLHKKRYNSKDAVEKRFQHTLKVMQRAAKRKGWELIDEAQAVQADGSIAVINGAGDVITGETPKVKLQEIPSTVPELNEMNLVRYFGKIFDREAHIRMIYDNAREAVETRFKVRNHVLLKGKVACAKTELYLAFGDFLGEHYIERMDATTMTKAGLERFLLAKAEAGTLKPILVMEEIEKCHPENLSCLIQIMDGRGKIQRTNATQGNVCEDCPLIIWGTCNNEDKLKGVFDKAIWSRFNTKMDCERPNRDLMKLILTQEAKRFNGKEEWVEPILKFCFDELQENPDFKDDFDDPRLAKSMLVGKDRLLNGTYFKDFRATRKSLRSLNPKVFGGF